MNEKKELEMSLLSKLFYGIRQRKSASLLFLLIILLVSATIVFLILDFKIVSIICSATIIVLAFVLLSSYYSSLAKQQIELDEMQKTIEQKERYLSDFSHRIRTPLNNFSFIIEYLIDSKPGGNQKEMLETLIASTTNMVEAVNDLTMKTAQDISYEPRKHIKFSLSSAVQSTIDLFNASRGSGISFTVNQSASLSDKYNGDPITIKQIFLDIFNALIIDKDCLMTVKVSINSSAIKGNIETIDFRISADCEVPLLNPEKNPDGVINIMAVKLIKGLNGKFNTTVSPKLSEFYFSLPLEMSAKEEAQSKAAERIKELKTGRTSKKKLTDANVLLVEDNPTNQKIVLITLKSLVKSIDTATTGKEALDHFGKSTYDIILMDIQLPIMDGITVAKKIREIEKSTSNHTPIIAITANAMIGDKEKCLSAGMDEYLSKPFQPSQLIEIIETYVTNS